MHDHREAFGERELPRESGVEEDGEDDGGDGEKGAVPALVNVCLVVEDNEALDDGADEEADAGEEGLPADCAEPAYVVRARRSVRAFFCLPSRGGKVEAF